MFRGLAKHAHLAGASQRAESLYKSMTVRAKNFEPTIILVNGALDVLAKAGDVDAIFQIASELPLEGPMKADAITYETVLGGLYRAGQKSSKDGHDRWESIISVSRRIWRDVLDRWIAGSLEVDVRLVNTMGWLLFQGSAKDLDDVLSLVEQTTGLARLYPPIGDPKRKVRDDMIAAPHDENTTQGPPYVKPSRSDLETTATDNSSSSEPAATEIAENEALVFKPVPLPKGRAFIRPDRRVLSRVMDVCNRFGAKKEAQEYWGIITKDLDPDLENYLSYLRLLRRSRASAESAALLEAMAKPKEEGGLDIGFSHKACFIAMDCCKLNYRSSSVIRNALSILSTAKRADQHPDRSTLERFGSLVASKKDVTAQEMRKISEALNTVFLSTKSQDSYERDDSSKLDAKDVKTGPPRPPSAGREVVDPASKREMVRMTSKITKDLLQAHGRDLAPELARKAKDMLWKQDVWLKRRGQKAKVRQDD